MSVNICRASNTLPTLFQDQSFHLTRYLPSATFQLFYSFNLVLFTFILPFHDHRSSIHSCLLLLLGNSSRHCISFAFLAIVLLSHFFCKIRLHFMILSISFFPLISNYDSPVSKLFPTTSDI